MAQGRLLALIVELLTLFAEQPPACSLTNVLFLIELSKITEGTWDELVHGRAQSTKPDVVDEDITADVFKRILKRVSRPTKKKPEGQPDSEKTET